MGLPWAPHNEAFDWVVRLEQRTFLQALLDKFPSVLSLRPLGTGSAWVLYRLGGHDAALVEFVNAALALAAWGWVARAAPQPRLFALLALIVGGVFFAGYIWVFHLHGIFYGPLLLFVAALVRSACAPIDARTLLGVFVGGATTALAHPYSLPLVVAFGLGAMLETPALRSRQGAAALAVLGIGSLAIYLLLVPGYNRAPAGDPMAGLLASYRTSEVNPGGAGLASLLAVWTASRAWAVAGGWLAGLLTMLLAIGAAGSGLPVLPLWLAWAALKCARRGRWTLAALVVACALLPVANPTGSPSYAIFAILVALFASTLDEARNEAWLRPLGSGTIAGVVTVALAVALAVRLGWPVPVVSPLAAPLLAEGERTRQFEVLVDRLMASPWRDEPARFVRPARSPAEADALDRRHRPPTDDHHLATWLDWKRGGPATGSDTLRIGFGGDAPEGMEAVLTARGRYAGDALVLRRSSAPSRADSLSTRP